MSFEVQREALEHDAKIWEATAGVLSTSSTSAAGLDMSTNALSIVSDFTGFTSTYSTIQDFVVGLLSDGSTATSTMAATLRDVKKQYEADETAAAARIGAEWSPVQ